MPTDHLDVPTAGYAPPPLPDSIPDELPGVPWQGTPLTAAAALTILPGG